VTDQNLAIFHAGIIYNDLITDKVRLIHKCKSMHCINVSYLLEETDHYRKKYAKFQYFIMHMKL
jgi:hypothetical protein